jgi:hypothetical protein
MLMLCPEFASAQADGVASRGQPAVPTVRGVTMGVQCGDMHTTDTIAPSRRGTVRGSDCTGDITRSWLQKADRLTLPLSDRLIAHGSLQFGTTSSHAAFGQTWQTSAGVSYRIPGGIEFTADIVGRRGYEAPLFMTAGAGADSIPFVTNSPMLDTTRRPVLWDTVLRMEKHLATAGRVRVSLVGEAHNLVNMNRDRDAKPLTETLTARVGRLGLKFTF